MAISHCIQNEVLCVTRLKKWPRVLEIIYPKRKKSGISNKKRQLIIYIFYSLDTVFSKMKDK